MKKLLLTIACMFTGMGAFAQMEGIELGGRLNFSYDRPHLGIGVVGRYHINDHFRPEVTLNFYPKDGKIDPAWDLNANLHYIFDITDRFKLYPLGGIGVIGYDSHTWLGANLGGGLQFNISKNLHLTAETYYQFVDGDARGITNVGLVYAF